MITNINDYKNYIMENNSNEPVEGVLYKIYDRTKGGSLIHSQAKYVSKDKNGYKFNLINRKEDNFIWLNNLNDYSFTETRDFTTKKK